jgi:hypothetical protein
VGGDGAGRPAGWPHSINDADSSGEFISIISYHIMPASQEINTIYICFIFLILLSYFQALSQATLANMPPIYGLYTSLIPPCTYAFFGSSMQLCVGPTALISLLMGAILTKYGVDADTDLQLAVDTCAQAAFCSGIIICVCGILNLGNMINFMSHPVMSGFTTGAACTIGLTQMKSAFGLTVPPPQVGRDVEYNYEVVQWYIDNFNGVDQHGYAYVNPYAVKVRSSNIYLTLFPFQIFV